MADKYYWLKLNKDFFNTKLLKAMARAPDGNKMIISYLKLLLSSLETKGELTYEELFDSFNEEMAALADIEVDMIDRIITMLEKNNQMVRPNDTTIILSYVKEMTGSESSSAARVRKYRENQKAKQLQSDTDTLQCNTETLQCNTDIDIEIEKEIEQSNNKNRHTKQPKVEKIKYAEFVQMTEADYKKLLDKYGEPKVKRMIEVLNNYKGSSGKKYKDDYRAILNWVVGRVEEEFSRAGGNQYDDNGQSADDWRNFKPSTGFKGWKNDTPFNPTEPDYWGSIASPTSDNTNNSTLSKQQDGAPDQQSYEDILTNM